MAHRKTLHLWVCNNLILVSDMRVWSNSNQQV
jgi:hypothetical protein